MKKILLICALFASHAQGYIENRSLYPVGESESLMANTGVALSGSTGAAIFNPAGLAGLKQRKLSLTGNTYMLFNVDQKPAIHYDDRDLSLSTSGLQAIPSSVISTGVWNAWTGAFVVVVPELVRVGQAATYETTNFDVVLSQMVDNQFMMIGFSAGAPLEKFDIGASCFVGNYTNHTSISVIGSPKNAALKADVLTGYSAADVKLLLCQAGAQGNFNANNRWGVVVRLPSFHLEGSGERSYFRQDTTGARQSTGVMKKSARYDIPLDVSLGFENHSFKNFTLLFDVSMQGSQSFENFEGSGDYTDTKSTFRGNAGFRYAYSETKNILGGLAYNPSAIDIRGAGDSKENYMSYSIGLEQREGSATMGVAFFATQSSGEQRLADGRTGDIASRATAVVLTTGFIF